MMRTEFHVGVYRSNVWEVKVITFSLGRGMEHSLASHTLFRILREALGKGSGELTVSNWCPPPESWRANQITFRA